MKRNAEFTLSLIATIFLTIGWVFTGVVTILVGFTPSTDGYGWFIYLMVYTLLSIPLLVLIWMATFKIKNNSKGWGIFILVMGVLYTLSVYFVPGILLLIAGIMMVAKKTDRLNVSA
ncbi:uncharacterized protein DUF4064 [Scopulibacillus darangshiensis]|uniref:Uncharacterized protein DUF4064 n=1 Tax=Scopulibacillus darangshiensis TaxID=442528 RepID=A0A4R2PAU3_9BACL|nr:DUF4064 domain-containing protein [Scopulibacillus darangshiensis]TCP32209.1 uncharacterized protein DUF4064 [Scopulibacillus darangshiensis]